MHEQQLDLKFKGGRNYIHGPDIYNQTLSRLCAEKPDVGDLDFAFHQMAEKQLKMMPGPLPPGVEAAAVCAYSHGGIRQKVYLVETEQPITERYPYPEDEIVAAAQIDPTKRDAWLREPVSFSDIEVWVALNKALHQQTFPHLTGKWLFVRARFPRYASHMDAGERRLHIAASFNNKLTRSEASINGIKVGEIYFSMV